VTCQLGDLPASNRATATVSITASQSLRRRSGIGDQQHFGPNPDNDRASGRVSFFAVANLSITKTSAPDPVVAGTNVTYTINVSNAGPSPTTNVVERHTLTGQVSDVTFTRAPARASAAFPATRALPLTCNLGTLFNGGAASIVVTAKSMRILLRARS
jgi:uncharacterized repeat protein (TIGR01451 family)